MGSKISIDKYVSRLEDILQLNIKHIEKVKLEVDIPENITQNIKLWRFHEENGQYKRIVSTPISLQNLQNQNFSFLSTECYVVLVVYRRDKSLGSSRLFRHLLITFLLHIPPRLAPDSANSFVSFPHSMWGIVESYNNLTPRGLENPLSRSEVNLEILDSFLLPTTSSKKERESMNFEHMIFVWNGKNSNPLIKSLALSSAYNLESLIEKGKDTLLQIFFSGGVILHDKLKNGKVIQLSSTSNNKPQQSQSSHSPLRGRGDLEREISKMSQTIFLFKFLFPLNSSRRQQPPPPPPPPQTTAFNAAAASIPSKRSGSATGRLGTAIPNNQQHKVDNIHHEGGTRDAEEGNVSAEGLDNSLNQQQQDFSASSVDSSTTAASETPQLRFFKREFCEERTHPMPNFFANFIRVPAPNKRHHNLHAEKHQQQQRIQAAKLYQSDNESHQSTALRNNFFSNEHIVPSPQQNIQTDYHPQQASSCTAVHSSPPSQAGSGQSKKNLISMKPLNLSNLNQLTAPPIADSHHHHHHIPCGEQPPLPPPLQSSFDGQSDSQRRITSRTLAEYNFQNGFEKLQNGGGGDAVIKLNIGYGSLMEDPQEKQYKLNYSARGKDKNYLYINMPLESAAAIAQEEEEEEQHQHPHHELIYSPQPLSSDRFRRNEAANQPIPPASHRGAIPSSGAPSYVLAEIERKQKQMNNFRLGGFSINTDAIKKPHSASYDEVVVDINAQGGVNDGGVIGGEVQIENPNDREDIYYGYNAEEEENGEPVNPYAKIKTFAQKCSEILPKFLYVSGQDVAYNKNKLKKNGITHIINCAGDVCKNMFPDDFVYKFYKLKDTKTENIECLFYDTIEFIEEVARQKGRVFIHCIQGVSRSISLCIAYIIWKQKFDFQDALMFVKKARGVASPNQGFLVQLINFYKRLYAPFDSITIKPRVWCVSSHQVEQPASIVAKMLLEGLYSHNMLDPRGVFIIMSSDRLYIWIGNTIPADRLAAYKSYAIAYLQNLRRYESADASEAERIIEQGNEPEEFWQLWFSERPQICYAQNKEWNNWFLDIADNAEGQASTYFQEELEEEETAECLSSKITTLLFVYPDPSTKLAVFDYDDLTDDSLCILCKLHGDIVKVLIWKGIDFSEPEETEQFFLDEIIQNNFPHHDVNKIFVQNEIPNQESDEFNDCFASS